MTESIQTGSKNLTPGERCPMSGHVLSFPDGDDWVDGEEGVCHYCGGTTRISVRGTDRFPWARALTHKVPR